jgi:hypothetical protein
MRANHTVYNRDTRKQAPLPAYTNEVQEETHRDEGMEELGAYTAPPITRKRTHTHTHPPYKHAVRLIASAD